MTNAAGWKVMIRLVGFGVLWVGVFGVRLLYRGDPRVMTKVGLFALFLVPMVVVLGLVQWVVRYRVPWWVEMFVLPFGAVGLMYGVMAIRG